MKSVRPEETAARPYRNLSLAQWERRCQKPDHRRIGNWMARRVSRPVALRITRVVAPWGVSADGMTLAAWTCGVAAAAAFGWGTVAGWLLGAALLQLWYLLDHVDGQLARLHGSASLDGVQLDYLMHHTLALLVPLGTGWGLFAQTSEPGWCIGGLVWGVSLLLLGLHHDARYKAFVQRLKALEGTLDVVGGGAFRRSPQPPIPRHPLRLAGWAMRKACEPHVVMNLLTLIAAVSWLIQDRHLFVGRCYLATAAAIALVTATGTIVRSQRQGACEQEFSAWFRAPQGRELVFVDGHWAVVSRKP
ncbi:MAG: CDP-alcohol phosphatidyltransferase family protein [Rhodopirellula sp.]|nr:CDP-alcohol phosphatidyltransferase family protein [Rhodopirellula sp.]